MTVLTVDDLARDLKVKNEDLLKELVTMGFSVDGPDSPLEIDDPTALKAHLVNAIPKREVVEQRIRPTVIRRRAKNPPHPEAGESFFEGQDGGSHEVAETVEEEPKDIRPPAINQTQPPDTRKPAHSRKQRKHEPARIIEMAPRPVKKEPVAVAPQEPATRVQKIESPREQAAEVAARIVETPETSVPAKPPVSETPVVESVSVVRDEVKPVEDRPATDEAVTEPIGSSPREPEESSESAEERAARKKKKKDKRMQPAQIIGRVQLKKEQPKEQPERERPPAPRPQAHRPHQPEAPTRPAPTEHPQRPYSPQAPSQRPTARLEQPFRPLIVEIPVEDERRPKRKKDKKVRSAVDEKIDDDKAKIRKPKEIINVSDLYDDRPRGGRIKKGKKPRPRKTEITTPKAIKRRIKLPEIVTVASLAHKMSVKAAEVIQQLIRLGVMAAMHETIDFDTATLVAGEFGFETETSRPTEKDMLPEKIADTTENLVSRPPVITVMGHVDHGKTSLLDRIRSTHVTDQEAGGITQHIGAYKVRLPKGELVFLDTPGHEAFTAMRARGAQVTDFVILVVAADDGVMEQTKEAINHARAANVPIIVAVNKIDKPEADKDRVLRELAEMNLIPEAWGGDTLFAEVSAKTGAGLDEFLDLILLQAEMLELKANPNKKAIGTVIEARLDKGRGPVATVLIREGTLRLGEPFVAGVHFGKIRAMLDHEGRSLEVAGPATPVEIQGFSSVPEAGEPFLVVDEEKLARQIGAHRQQKIREDSAASTSPASLEDLMARMTKMEQPELNIIIKADVQGSVEALKEALLAIPSSEVIQKVIHSGVGAVNESDVMLASASRAIIIGFNVRPTVKTAQLVEQEKIDLRLYTVIYEAIEDVRKAMEGLLAPIERESVTGRAEVRQTFSVPKIGLIAGCYITSGKIERSNQIRLLRDNVVIHTGKIASMRRFKDDVKEAVEGYECGIGIENFRDIKIGDIIEAFVISKESAKL